MSSINTIENQTLALAGIFQAVHLCKALATTGECDQDDLRGTLRSILTLNTDRVIDAYGGNPQSVKRGLRVLKNQLISNDEMRDLDISRYALGLIQLGTNILNDQATVEQLRIASVIHSRWKVQSLVLRRSTPWLVSTAAALANSARALWSTVMKPTLPITQSHQQYAPHC